FCADCYYDIFGDCYRMVFFIRARLCKWGVRKSDCGIDYRLPLCFRFSHPNIHHGWEWASSPDRDIIERRKMLRTARRESLYIIRQDRLADKRFSASHEQSCS